MDLRKLNDRQLLSQIKMLASNERQILTRILRHLREVERRKLFSDLHFQSLFEYAVKELKYSEGQASRRISAMRLIKELPQVEDKIASGTLSLSNVSQAQSFFREAKKREQTLAPISKWNVLKNLENKSAREGQRELLKLQPLNALPKERERVLDEKHTELRLVIPHELKKQVELFRSLLGPKGNDMNWSELLGEMTKIGIEALKTKKFGKKRVSSHASLATSAKRGVNESRRVCREDQFHTWTESNGKCGNCGGQRNLNIDHIHPVALGGRSTAENLRLLCFHCNQREAMKVFGVESMERARTKTRTASGRGFLEGKSYTSARLRRG